MPVGGVQDLQHVSVLVGFIWPMIAETPPRPDASFRGSSAESFRKSPMPELRLSSGQLSLVLNTKKSHIYHNKAIVCAFHKGNFACAFH